MNRVIQVNLAGLSFTFDEAAYAQLDDYLARLDGYFRGSPGHAEIMSDIESRLAELFTQHTRGRQIVTLADVEAATATLGQPEALADAAFADADEPRHSSPHYDHPEPAMNGSYASAHARHPNPYARPHKRLLRDPEDKVISGVCSGLAAYFGIQDPLYVRLGFAAAFFGAGIGLLPYLILWIVMPQARTAADRLAMRGEPINVETISRQVEEEARDLSSRARDLGQWARAEASNKASWKERFDPDGWRDSWRRRSSANGSATYTPPRNSEEQQKRYSDEGYVS